MSDISFRTGNDIELDAVIALYVESTLGARRPVTDRARMEQMLKQANLVITAWDGAELVGIARSLTDWVYVTYLSDLAVRKDYQKRGIGRELIQRTREACDPRAMLVLLAAPAAEKYYPHIGFEHHAQAWIVRGQG